MLTLRKLVERGSNRVYQHCSSSSSSLSSISSLPSRWHASPRAFYSTAPPSQAPPHFRALSESFLNGSSAVYVDEMYHAWKSDPNSVHKSWDAFFRNSDAGIAPGGAYMSPPTLGGSGASVSSATPSSLGDDSTRVTDSMKLVLLIRSYQVRGHCISNLDPLGMDVRVEPPELKASKYGFTDADMDREIFVGGDNLISGFLSSGKKVTTLREVLKRLRETYCGTIGVEYMHIQERDQCDWIRERFETPSKYSFPSEDRVRILDRLAWADQFERFLGIKYQTNKRFGLDGCESLIPGLKALIDTASDLGVNSIVIGMPHRGRMNVLANVVRKPLNVIFNEFNGGVVTPDLGDEYSPSGDVKYHLGTSYDRPARNGKRVHLSLVANPSHLEAVDPVVEGKTRAKQHYANDTDRSQVMPIIMHGDAAFAGQGVVYETLHLSYLKNYTTGGTIHVVVNNQIGFTTDPKSSRSSMYCTDVAKTIGAPIFHVNGDDPEAVVYVMQLAASWRQTFKKDVIVDIVCYRRYGHNEIDQPHFTQPLMYQKIEKHTPILQKYSQQLIDEKVITKEKYDELISKILSVYNKGFEEGKTTVPRASEWLESRWKDYKSPAQLARIGQTGLPLETLKSIGKVLSTLPEDFTPHRNIKKTLNDKLAMFETGKGFDFATAEALAFGSLLLENNHVRLSGQDVERGTFSHRHAVLHDQKNGSTHTPLTNLSPKQAAFTVSNSSLSEFAVLGFELGYSLENPNSLILWEAQFGDFANGAQVIIDQFISSGEMKWMRQSGLVLLLPHGYDGAGPEHSSARLERFLQLSDSDPTKVPAKNEGERKQMQHANWCVVNCTTAANYFHVLRRQVHRDFRKPLIIMTSKSLLRADVAKSDLSEFTDSSENNKFRRVIPEATPDAINPPAKVTRLVFCSGQVYYDLVEARTRYNVKDVALIRVEQLYPFPFDLVTQQADLYSNADVVWCQEEPTNMGAWHFVFPHLLTSLSHLKKTPRCAGRPVSASPAVASVKLHNSQLETILSDALKVKVQLKSSGK